MIRNALASAAALVALALAPSLARADFAGYVDFTALNHSGVTGTATLRLVGTELTVTIAAAGLEPNMVHPQHIHGLFENGISGTPMDSTIPVPESEYDTDHNGILTVGEGAAAYGSILVPLTSPPGGALGNFPTAPGGVLTFSQTYDLTDPSVFATIGNTSDHYSMADLTPLDYRVIVLHGMTVNGSYDPTLPIAAGVIRAVPEPASIALVGLGLAGVFAIGRRRRRDG